VPLLLVGTIAVLVLLALGAWWTTSRVETESIPVEADVAHSFDPDDSNVLRNSIAVLPFDNLSPDPKDGYFAAGIHDEVLNQLSKIKDLSVIARTTMLRYAGSDKSVPEIGDELNVSTVMEGSVRYAGNRVRVTAQLIDSASGAHLWSEAYEENLEDIFGVQLAIASQIAATLGAEFSLVERERIGRRATKNTEAYGHYLRALSEWGNLAAAGPVHQALDAAILLDPDFGSALAFKAWIYFVEAAYGNIFLGRAFNAEDQEDRIRLSERFARRALEIDDQEARGHLALAFISLHGRRWRAAFDSFDRAYALEPNDFAIGNAKGWSMYWRNGDIGSAVRYLDRSMELNPADAGNMWNIGEFFYIAQRWKAARTQANLVIGLLPDLGVGHAQLALVSSRLGDVAAVHRNAQLAETRNPGLDEYESLARAYGQIGDVTQARRIFELSGAGDDSEIPNLGWQFWMHMAVKDYDSAISYLERIVGQNFPFNSVVELHTNPNHPDYDPIRSYPAFDDLVRKAGTPFNQAD
jgi:TolB-like protein